MKTGNSIDYLSIAVAGLAVYSAYSALGRMFSSHKYDSQIREELAALRSSNEFTSGMRKVMRDYQPIEFAEERKFFLEESSRVFNVEPLSEMVMDNATRDIMLRHDPTSDKYYLNDPAGVDWNSQMYAGYYHAQQALDRMSYVKWCGKEMGFGLFANINLPKGAYLGEFSGILTNEPVPTDYMWTYAFDVAKDKSEGRGYGVDARFAGNYLRFANHVDGKVNVKITYFIRDGMWRLAYVTTKAVAKDEELYISYGVAYWKARKYFDPFEGEYKELS
eukprot:Partr_v1_DN28887_c0_g1_i5_m33257